MIPLFKVAMHPDAIKAVSEVMSSGFIGQGKVNDQFEDALKDRFGIDHIATVNSATAAETLAFHIMKQRGNPLADEVLTTGLSCLATQTPIVDQGFKIRWVDIDPKTFNLDLDDLERKVTPKTKCIYVVHWGGYPVDLDRVSRIADRAEAEFGYRPFILEDCAHAFGSKYKGKLIGTSGNLCSFSFQAIKHLTSIDGGMLTCHGQQWRDFYKDVRLQRWFGIDRDDTSRQDFRCENDVRHAGLKAHMNDVNAACGLANLQLVDHNIEIHKSNAKFYDNSLLDMGGAIETLQREPGYESSFWIYSLLVENRKDFMRALKDRGIMTSQVHERNDFNSCFAKFSSFLPALDRNIGRLVHIPVGWWVTPEMRQEVVDAIHKGW